MVTDTDTTERFARHWERFLTRFGKQDNGNPRMFDLLLGHYSEPERFYHGMGHIVAGLDVLETIRLKCPALFEDPVADAAIELSYWTHDFYNRVLRRDNEERSAEFAIWCAALLGFQLHTAVLVSHCVKATTHRRMAMGLVAQIVCDIDLVSLAAPWERFERHTAWIRREYRHLSDEQWRRGRIKFLGNMLDVKKRRSIYQTDIFSNLEDPARKNMQRAIEVLGMELVPQ